MPFRERSALIKSGHRQSASARGIRVPRGTAHLASDAIYKRPRLAPRAVAILEPYSEKKTAKVIIGQQSGDENRNAHERNVARICASRVFFAATGAPFCAPAQARFTFAAEMSHWGFRLRNIALQNDVVAAIAVFQSAERLTAPIPYLI